MNPLRRRAVVCALACASALIAGAPAQAAETPLARSSGRPKVKLDRLEFPADVRGAATYKKFLRRQLAREARRVQWGAGRDATIEYRYFVTELKLTNEDGVLRIRCSAVGRLPKGRRAKSQLTFSGHPRKRDKLIRNVLTIVARGVLARLAELERARRGVDAED